MAEDYLQTATNNQKIHLGFQASKEKYDKFEEIWIKITNPLDLFVKISQFYIFEIGVNS